MRKILPWLILSMLACAGVNHAATQIEQFTYQGRLQLNGQPATGNFNMTFSLFDAQTSGTQVGSTITITGIAVTDGGFAVNLNYPGAFTGSQLWLDITVNGQPLGSRQAVTATPVAQFAMNGASALSYNNQSPSSAASPPVTTLATVGPFTFKATCALGASNQVTATLSVSSTSNYDLSEIISSQLNLYSRPTSGPGTRENSIPITRISIRRWLTCRGLLPHLGFCRRFSIRSAPLGGQRLGACLHGRGCTGGESFLPDRGDGNTRHLTGRHCI